MKGKIMTIKEIAKEASKIYERHVETVYFDSKFDGGEFSEAAHQRMIEEEIADLAITNGFTPEQVDEAMKQYWHQEEVLGDFL